MAAIDLSEGEESAQWVAIFSLLSYLFVSSATCCKELRRVGPDACLQRLAAASERFVESGMERFGCRKKVVRQEDQDSPDLQFHAIQFANQRHLTNVRRCCIIIAPLLAISVGIMTYRFRTGTLVLGFLTSGFGAFIPSLWLALVSLVWPNQPGAVMKKAYKCAVFLCLLNGLFHFPTVGALVFDQVNTFNWRLGMGLVISGEFYFAALLNVLYSCCAVTQFLRLLATAREAPGTQPEDIFGGALESRFFQSEIFQLVVVLALTYAAEWRAFAEAKATVEAKHAQSFHTSVRLLLDHMCDVVLELDSKFAITAGAERLGALLLQGHELLRGVHFPDLISSDVDIQLFEEHVTQSAADIFSERTPCRIHLRDSLRNTLQVTIRHCTVVRLDGSLRHLVGVTEVETDDTLHEDDEFLELSRNRTHSHRRRPESKGLQGGTPRIYEPQHLGERCSLSSDAYKSLQSKLAYPELAETDLGMRCSSLLSLACRWNVQVTNMNCCALHAAMKDAKTIIQVLLPSLTCKDAEDIYRASEYNVQCVRCGMLYRIDEVAGDLGEEDCKYCRGHDLFAAKQRNAKTSKSLESHSQACPIRTLAL